MSTKNIEYVEVPKHTIKLNRDDGKKYIYLITESFRNSKGKPDNKKVLIGRYDEEKDKLIPNLNYYNLFKKEKPVNYPDIIMKCGSYVLLKKICEENGLEDVIYDVFKEEGDLILTVAHYMITYGSVIYYIDDWYESYETFTNKKLNDVNIGRMFRSITEEKKRQFFTKWVNSSKEKEYIAYDVTSISSYSRGLENVEYGYNRDKESLPQINFGMYYGENSKTPYYFRIYPGSINDKTHLEYMINDSDEIKLKKAYFVMDKGFYTKDNLQYVIDKNHQFMIPIPSTTKLYKKYVDKYKNEIKDNIKYKLKDQLIYCKKVETNDLGFRMNIHIYYNQNKSAENANAVYERIDKLTKDLEKITIMPSKNSIYHDYFNLSQTGNKITAKLKEDYVNQELSRCGFFAIGEIIFTKDSEQILETYRNRDSIEKCFDDLKNEIDMNRLYCSSNEISNGKLFTAFISLIFISYIRRKLSNYCNKSKMTLKKVLLELDKIKVMYDSKSITKAKFINPLTKTQKEILSFFNFSEQDFLNFSF